MKLILENQPLNEKHTSENLNKFFKDSLKRWGLENKWCFLTADSASNNLGAFKS